MEKQINGLIIGLDFDGTVTTHEYPNIGKELPECLRVLKRLIDEGARICLNTMRHGEKLQESLDYLKENGIELWGVNCNPEQSSWSLSPKVYAHIYIDDEALGCPLIIDPSFSDRPFVNWLKVEQMLFTTKTTNNEQI